MEVAAGGGSTCRLLSRLSRVFQRSQFVFSALAVPYANLVEISIRTSMDSKGVDWTPLGELDTLLEEDVLTRKWDLHELGWFKTSFLSTFDSVCKVRDRAKDGPIGYQLVSSVLFSSLSSPSPPRSPR